MDSLPVSSYTRGFRWMLLIGIICFMCAIGNVLGVYVLFFYIAGFVSLAISGLCWWLAKREARNS